MRVFMTTFWLPKAGNALAEYEDAFYPQYAGERTAAQLRFAVSDGASEGMLSGQWASILARLYCRAVRATTRLDSLLDHALPAWEAWTADYLEQRVQENRPLQWFEEPGLQRGAFATLLGLHLAEYKGLCRWSALALGDSCLFQIRDSRLIAAFPLQHAEEFSSRPFLIASNPALNNGLAERVQHVKGDWQPGDRFYLVTDALAAWFLDEYETGSQPWVPLHENSTDPHSFEEWVGTLRSSKLMRNDDVTLLSIEMA
jgi:hypothetical protein